MTQTIGLSDVEHKKRWAAQLWKITKILATFIHISLHTYSSNVVTLSKPNLVNKQQNILNLCLLLTYNKYLRIS